MSKAAGEQIWVWLDDPAYGSLQQILFTRVVFNVATANRDDHLRNHGFIRSPAGWRLAPVFDMNPSFKKEEHVLSLDLYSRKPNMEVVLSTAGFYRLEQSRAKEIIVAVCAAVGKWQTHARKLGLSRQECAEAAHLFRSFGRPEMMLGEHNV